jgi:endogenous inhibitor of DNA gyrase (YacG/DUF329 family)
METNPANSSRPCPICGKPPTLQNRPFCSSRCAQIDLGRWLKGNYRIPTAETPEEGDSEEHRDITNDD